MCAHRKSSRPQATLEQRVAERSAAAEQRTQELARSQEALQNQTRILQSILDSMGDGVIVADEDGKFILFNPAAEEILAVGLARCTDEQWADRYGFYLPDMVTPYPLTNSLSYRPYAATL